MDENRRHFLKVGAAVTALSQSRVWGANDRIRLGAIGTGGRMQGLLSAAAKNPGNELVAVCDVYQPRIAQTRERFAPSAEGYDDYRRVLDRKDIDAVVIAAPDHWHVPMASDAVQAGKDVYMEKPVTHTLDQGPLLINAVRATDRVVQTGMQQRSWPHFQTAVEMIQAGNLGKITLVRTYWCQNYTARPARPPAPIDTAQLDWKRWLGSAPDQPFDTLRFTTWRWFWDFGGGALTDLFTHWVDVVHWAMGSDTPSSALTLGHKFLFPEWDLPDTVLASFEYPEFLCMYDGTLDCSLGDGGLVFRGSNGMMQLDRMRLSVWPETSDFSAYRAEPIVNLPSKIDGTIPHMGNFFDCIRSRKQPNAPVEAGVAAARAAHLGNLALKSGGRVNLAEHAKSGSG